MNKVSILAQYQAQIDNLLIKARGLEKLFEEYKNHTLIFTTEKKKFIGCLDQSSPISIIGSQIRIRFWAVKNNKIYKQGRIIPVEDIIDITISPQQFIIPQG